MRSLYVHRPRGSKYAWVEFFARARPRGPQAPEHASTFEVVSTFEVWNQEDLRAAIAELVALANDWDDELREVVADNAAYQATKGLD